MQIHENASFLLVPISDDDYLEQKQDGENSNQRAQAASLLDTPQNVAAIEHKKGYMMRKCCYESNYKKSKCFPIQMQRKFKR